MSGGGPSRSPQAVSGETTLADCGSIQFETDLASPQPTVVATLIVGAMLDVQLDTTGARVVVAAVTASGATAGSIATRAAQLIRCIRAGYSYRAEVLEINGGVVRVRLAPA
jgi:hypothetical protein